MTRKPREKTPKQNRTLNWLLTEAGLSGDAARDYLEAVCGKRYRRDMDFYDYRYCIDDLNTRLGNPLKNNAKGRPTTRVNKPNPQQSAPDNPMTSEQREFMHDLFHQVGATTVRQQVGISEKSVGKKFPFTVAEGQKVIEALKHMKKRGYHMDADNEKSTHADSPSEKGSEA